MWVESVYSDRRCFPEVAAEYAVNFIFYGEFKRLTYVRSFSYWRLVSEAAEDRKGSIGFHLFQVYELIG